jgi:3-hydroxy-9,10-secoandrosta-1,3,5(10)-triene-9,17-dione monooxygenase reductase component
MHLDAEPVIEHIEYRADAAQHDAFVAAFTKARSFGLAARGCRSIELTRGSAETTEYRARIEWRSGAERAAFAASEAAVAFEAAMAGFPRSAHHIDARVLVGRNEVELDSSELRRAFGHYPTGVAVITAASPDGPVGMVVSSFTTVSLRPPLVAFCAAHTSTTWPLIADARSCCINVLASSQEELCQQLAKKGEQRFESVVWSAAPSGAPILAGVVGWLECVIVEVRLAGDHDLVLLQVLAHDLNAEREPLLFHRSSYRAFR